MARSRNIAWASTLLFACTPPDVATVSIGLGDVPERVETIVVSVLDVDARLVVASATVTAPTTIVELGVPAEVPLLFRAVARTDRPGPRLVGGVMPAYVARSQRTIALGSEQVAVDLLARPAGVLTVFMASTDTEELLLADDANESRPVRVAIERGGERAIVLPVGRYTATAPPFVVPQGEGLFVAREQESIAALTLERPPNREDPLRALVVTRADCDGCRDVVTSTAATTTLSLAIEATGQSGLLVDVEDAELTFAVEAVPPSILVEAPPPMVRDLPAVIEGIRVRGRGRIQVLVTAASDGEAVRGTFQANVRYEDERAGDPVRLEASLVEPERLARGTQLRLALLDASDRFARSIPGRVDFEGTSPHVHLPQGREFELLGDERGVLLRRIARPSAPRGVPVSVVVTVTSTVGPGTWATTLTLPVLPVPTPGGE